MKGSLFIILACFLWAADSLIRYPLIYQGIDAIAIVIVEHVFLTSMFLGVIYRGRKKIWNSKISHLFYFAVIGCLGSALGTVAFTKAFSILNPSVVILLQKLQPVVAIMLAHVILKEKLKPQFILWASICLVGGIVVSYKDLTGLSGSWSFQEDKALLGYMLVLVSVVSWGSATVFGKKLSLEGYDHKEIMAGRFLFGLVTLLPFVLTGTVNPVLPKYVLGKICIMVILSGFLGMYFYYLGLKRVSARVSALTEMIFPFAAVCVNWIFLDKTLEPSQMLGGGLLLLGSLVIQIKHY